MLDPVELFPEVPNIYAFPCGHADMVFDKSRVAAYRDAINETVKPGDVVADLGSGTGLLSFLCLQAGAARVHAIERSDVIDFHADQNLSNVNVISVEEFCRNREMLTIHFPSPRGGPELATASLYGLMPT